jgi:hypothetical protein
LLAAAVSAERALLVIGRTTCLQESAAARYQMSKMVHRQAISHQTLRQFGAVGSQNCY